MNMITAALFTSANNAENISFRAWDATAEYAQAAAKDTLTSGQSHLAKACLKYHTGILY